MPGAARVDADKAVLNLRGENGAKTGRLAVDSNLNRKGVESYVATVAQVFVLWQDFQAREDTFMKTYTKYSWVLITFGRPPKQDLAGGHRRRGPHGHRLAFPPAVQHTA